MANPKLRLAENVEGAFFVDETCIDCDTCRQLAPASFRDHGGQSSVYRQPAGEEEARLAMMALVACPSGSIGAGERLNAKIGIGAFPHLIAENVYYCGFNSEKSFGAWSYLIVRAPENGGNILVDSPRFTAPLVRQIEKMGGVARMFLTHRDDIAEHQAFNEKFGASRVMHAADGAKNIGVELVIEGEEAVKLDDELTVIPVPGHTRGSQVLLYKNKFLFTGDHLAWSPRRKSLTAFRSVAWYSWEKQTRSMQKLLEYDFEWVLPGHGRIAQRPKQEMREHLMGCIEWMKRV
ncbi:MAG TPA: MBL fold metallo-hydrolase [Pyrinomonadaceae bacterium]|jgi:glyoxylase-like metal-dependent hydrolase (beta-lactamase superfamily II)/ferredoxin